MSWWGKLVGGTFGFMLGGPLGALLGGMLGHNFDRGLKGNTIGFNPGDQERVQTAFFTASFAVMGCVAKADGRVSAEEIRMAEMVMAQMDLRGEKRAAAMHLFNQGKRDDFPLQEVLEQFRRECHNRSTLIRMFMEIQLNAAYADGELHTTEERLLLDMCAVLGFSQREFRRLEQMVQAALHQGQQRAGAAGRQGPTATDAYAILGVSAKASDKDVKRAYRRLLSQHHPDKLVSKGLPEEMMKVAAKKTHEIKQAWEAIKSARGI